jgi:DNA polymerase-3 subunit gamma/tau
MLTGAAFNALLKTLEEPPAHAVFVLATTEYEKLPATITSRTQRFLFKKVPKAKIIEKLREIAAAETIIIDNGALELVSAAAEGSLRDAESLLDQLASSAKSIDVKTAEELTGRVGLKKVRELAGHIVARDLAGALAYLGTLHEEGHNLPQLTRDLIHYLRKVLAIKINPALESVFHGELSSDEIADLKKLAEGADPALLVPLIKALIRGYSEMRYSPFAMIPLEVALIEQIGGQEKAAAHH